LLSWNYYVKRKRLNVDAFLKNNNIKNYGDFCQCLKRIGVEPPIKKLAPKFKAPKFKAPKFKAPITPIKPVIEKSGKKLVKKTYKKSAASVKSTKHILSVENDTIDTTP